MIFIFVHATVWGEVSYDRISSFFLTIVPKRLMAIVESISSEKNQSIHFILNLDNFTNTLDFTRLIKSTLSWSKSSGEDEQCY